MTRNLASSFLLLTAGIKIMSRRMSCLCVPHGSPTYFADESVVGGGCGISYRFNVSRFVDGFLHLSGVSAALPGKQYGEKNHVIYAGGDPE
jgi:hypothetical protein